jgi:molybdopterin molybdotransferase
VTAVTETEQVPIESALGRVLATTVLADINVPTHANSAMDGYGVRHADLAADATTTLTVVAEIAAGDYRAQPLERGQAVRILTGAPVPPGCDCVVIQEVVERDRDRIRVPSGQTKGQFVRPAGEDLQLGTEVFPVGRRLSAADMGVLAALGRHRIGVFRRITVAVLSTGNEVAKPGSRLAPGHVYDSNRVSLSGVLQGLGAEVLDLGLARDQREEIAAALRHGARQADVILTSGGVSVGDFDLVKDVIAELGEIDFWQVRMKPGKPQAHGRLGRALFFGLPGNPVSSLAVFQLIVRPALLKLMGAEVTSPRTLQLPLRGTIDKRHDRMDFQRGIVHFDPDGAWVESTGTQSSGALSSMARANAFIVLPVEPVTVDSGEPVQVWLFDD